MYNQIKIIYIIKSTGYLSTKSTWATSISNQPGLVMSCSYTCTVISFIQSGSSGFFLVVLFLSIAWLSGLGR